MPTQAFNTTKFQNVQFVLMDIEGTTTDIHFVKEILFPYSAREMRNFISRNRTNPQVRECLKSIGGASDEECITQLLTWIQQDVKHPALKTLQGLIWQRGYEEKVYTSHIYQDVLPAWQKWLAGTKRHLGIYSSGSVPAQKLLFKYTSQGDLLKYLDAHFDLAVGGKREKQSYSKIVDILKIPADKILFLSDITEELDAAQTAGLLVAHIVRPGTTESTKYKSYRSFSEI
jgi:enolase-phosphatase E1